MKKETRYTIVFVTLLCLATFFSIRNANEYKSSEQEAAAQTQNADLTLKLAEAEKQIQTLSVTERSTNDIVKEWAPQVAFVACVWLSPDTKVYVTESGSGFLTNHTNGQLTVMTNKHVMLMDNIRPTACGVTFLNGDKYTVFDSSESYSYSNMYDRGNISIPDMKPSTKALVKRTDGFYCGTQSEIGDKVVVLGYPGIGASEGITATEGIISGKEGVNYVTSAKIDRGNSGGIAVSVKNNCIVGIPSSSLSGSVESLGRILSSDALLAQ